MAATPAAVEVRHHRFQTSELDALDSVLATQAADRFGLIRIVPVDADWSVAVFERTIPTEKPPTVKP